MISSLIDNRQIRVFISSTFQDMQDERDYLMLHTFPRLRALAAQRDVTLTELDLRWGITKQESETGKVVGICLDEIENSVPFFIGIIGNRYGWIPKRSDIDKRVTSRFKPVKSYLARNLSVTEMEMQFGVLERPEDMHAYFYIKNEENAEIDVPEKLAALKKAVKENGRYPVSYYMSSENLATQIEEAFTRLLNDLFPMDHLSELEKERIRQRAFLNQLCKHYVRQDSQFECLDKWLNNWDMHYLVVIGESGQGKSSLIANWVREKIIDSSQDFKLIYHFIGNGGSEGDKEHIVKTLIEEIQDSFGFETSESLSREDQLTELFGRVSASGQRLLIALDAVNQLADYDCSKQLRWLPAASKSIKILFSTLPEDPTAKIFQSRKYPFLVLRRMNNEQRGVFIKKYLSSFGKKLTKKQCQVVSNAPVASNALVLSTILDELIRFGRFDTLEETIDYYISAKDIDTFYNRLLNRYEQDLDTTTGVFLMYLAVSRYGLKESEIIKLTKLAPVQWSEFYSVFRPHFVTRNGLVYFAHERLKKVVVSRYLESMPEVVRQMRLNISCHFDSDFKRNCEEVPYQDFILGNPQALYNTLIRPGVFGQCYMEDEEQLTCYWRYLIENGYHITDYLKKVKEKGYLLFAHYLSRFCYSQLHDSKSALLFAEEELRLFNNGSELDLKDKYTAFNDIANSYADACDYTQAISYRLKALDALSSIKNGDMSDKARVYSDLGEDYFGNEEFNKALDSSMQALLLRKKTDGENGPLTAICYNNLGVILGKLDRSKEALEYAQKTLMIRKRLFGDEFAPTIIAYSNVGFCYSNLNHGAQAVKYYKKAIGLGIATYGEYYDGLTAPYLNMGAEYKERGNYKRAAFWYKKAFESQVKVRGINHPETDRYLKTLIDIYYKAGNKKECLRYQKKRLELVLANRGMDSKDLPYLYNNIGVLHRKLGHRRLMILFAQKAVEESMRILGSCVDTGLAFDRLGLAYQAAGDVENARKAFQDALEMLKANDAQSELIAATSRKLRGLNG